MKKINPKILVGLACVGVGVTAYFAIKETKKIPEEEKQPEVEEPKIPEKLAKDIYKFAWQYKGTIISAGVTIGCILGAEKINEKDLAAATATIGFLAANRDKAEKFLAGYKDSDGFANYFHEKVHEEHREIDNSKLLPIEETGNGKELFRETYTGRWFRSNLDAVHQAIRRIEDRLDNGEILSYNDVYDEFGLAKTMHGGTIGLNREYMSFVNDIFFLNEMDVPGFEKYTRIDLEPACFPCNWYRT